MQREPALAGAAGPCNGQHPNSLLDEQALCFCHLAGAADEGGQLGRQIAGGSALTPQRRELRGQILANDLKDGLRLSEVSQPMLSEVAQRNPRGQGISQEIASRFRDEYLASRGG